METFAKLYERDGIQVLVKLDKSDKGEPEVRFYFQPKGLGVCSYAHTFEDSGHGCTEAELRFSSMTEERALSMAKDVLRIIDELGDD